MAKAAKATHAAVAVPAPVDRSSAMKVATVNGKSTGSVRLSATVVVVFTPICTLMGDAHVLGRTRSGVVGERTCTSFTNGP